MKITKITKDNEMSFISFFPGSAAKASPKVIRIGVTDDSGSAAGAVSAGIGSPHADLISLYVLPRFRRQGYGSALMDQLLSILKDIGSADLSGEYLDDDELNGFFSAKGFDLFPGYPQFYTTVGDVLRSPLLKRLNKIKGTGDIKTVSSLSVMEKKIFDGSVANKDYDPDFSTALIKNGRYYSCLLANRSEDGINVIWNDSVAKSPDEFRRHTHDFTKKVISEYSDRPDTPIHMTFERQVVIDFIEKTLGGKGHLRSEGRYVNVVKLLVSEAGG